MEDVNAKIQVAAYRILQAITPRKQAQYVMAISAGLAMVSMTMPGETLPAGLAVIATGLGVEALGSLLSDLVNGKDTSDDEILRRVEEAIPAGSVDELLASNRELVVQVTQLTSWQHQIKFIIERDQNLAESLTQQFTVLATDISAMRAALEQTATQEQNEEIKAMIQQVIEILDILAQEKNANETTVWVSSVKNPFGRTGKIQDPANYLVRQPLTRHVFEELEKGVSLSVVGESQSGKSSLLWHVCRAGAAALQRPAADFVYLDMQLLSNDDDFFDCVCHELGVPVSRGYRLGRHLRGRNVVLCLDEIEKMTWQGFSLELRTQLRGLADGPQAPLTLMIASRSPLSQLFPDSPEMTSPLAGLCMQININPFTLAEAEALAAQYLDGSGRVLPPDAVADAWRQSEGRPARLQRALHAAFARAFGQ